MAFLETRRLGWWVTLAVGAVVCVGILPGAWRDFQLWRGAADDPSVRALYLTSLELDLGLFLLVALITVFALWLWDVPEQER